MEQRIKDIILQQKSALCLFVEDDRAFYDQYCHQFTDRIIREKRILEFENPNRVKVTYEYDVVPETKSETTSDGILFLFLPDKRKSWLKIFYSGKRLAVPNSATIRDYLFKIVNIDLERLIKDAELEDDAKKLWELIWQEKGSIPCFVYEGKGIEGGVIEIVFYDFLDKDEDKRRCCCRLFDQKYYKYSFPKEAKGNSWLYVKSPNKFEVAVSYKDDGVKPNQNDDPEIQSYTIFSGKGEDVVDFKITVKVPRTLKFWYGALVGLGIAYVIVFLFVAAKAMYQGLTIKEFSPVYAQVGISIIAAIIATRGWLMNEETVLGRVSKWFTWLAIFIVAMLVGVYTAFMLVL